MKYLLIVLAILLASGLVVVVEAALASRGEREQFVNPDRQPQRFGQTGSPLTYVVMGDSTAAGQGAPQAAGIAPRTATTLGQTRQVTLTNVGVSGATMADVLAEQAPVVEKLKPDLVLIAASANDVTKLTSTRTVARQLNETVDRLVAANCNVKIVVIGSPDFGGVHRFQQPLRTIAGWRSRQMTATVRRVATDRQLTFAPIAEATGPAFRKDPSLLAADKFHPNETGYGLWVPVLETALAEALAAQPSHCR
jgi:lysophospholipase L1-like esterase